MSQVTIQQIADALGRDRSSTVRRAAKECWPYTEVKARGGKRRLYALADLPHLVRLALAGEAIHPQGCIRAAKRSYRHAITTADLKVLAAALSDVADYQAGVAAQLAKISNALRTAGKEGGA